MIAHDPDAPVAFPFTGSIGFLRPYGEEAKIIQHCRDGSLHVRRLGAVGIDASAHRRIARDDIAETFEKATAKAPTPKRRRQAHRG